LKGFYYLGSFGSSVVDSSKPLMIFLQVINSGFELELEAEAEAEYY